MIDRALSEKILTIGPVAKPLGGISQVIINYMTDVYPVMLRTEFNTGTSGAYVRNSLAFVRSLAKQTWLLATNRDLAIVHIHTASGVTFARTSVNWLVARLFGKKTLIHIHAGSFPLYYAKHSRFVGHVLKNSDCVVCLSPEWERFYTDKVGLSNVRIVNNVIPAPDVDSARPATGGDGKLHLLFLGHMIPNKGIFDLLDVMADNAARFHGKVHLHIGGSRNEAQVRERIGQAGIGDMVTFEGWVAGEAKKSLLRRCDIFVLPSYIEGVPISILECMSHRMAIISTRVGGIPSIVRDGVNGTLLTPGDKPALAAAISRYVDSPALAARHGDSSAELVRPYLPDAVSLTLESLYQELLHHHDTPTSP